jgi:hypothetical protein
MKRFLEIALLIVFFFSGIFVFSKVYKREDLKLPDSMLQWNIKYKGLKGARDFAFDGNGNYYLAFSNRIQFIDRNGKSAILFEDSKLDITSITYINGSLYYISGCKLVGYNLRNKKNQELIKNLPNFGDYKDSKLLAKDNILYIGVGAATNSAVVGEDNLWLKDNPFNHDLSPKTLTINGKNASKQKSGAFVQFNTKNAAGQIITAHFPGNASVIGYNTENGNSWLYAWGIRNIKGMDFNSEGKIFITVGGLEERGSRPVKGDVDYVYELKENIWYGWPDYSGGDPLTSPRFKGANNERVSFVLDKHPTTNPPAPLYQHKSLSVLRDVIVDRKGAFGEKDSIYFYDTKDNILYEINKNGIVKEKIRFEAISSICSIKIQDNSIILLDSDKGTISTVTMSINKGVVLSKGIGYYVLILLALLIGSIMWKMKN